MAWTRTRRGLLTGMGASIGVAGLALAGCNRRPSREEPELSVCTWPEFLGSTTLADFKASSGVVTRASTFVSSEDLFNRLRAGGAAWDVIALNDQAVARLIKADLLQPIDHDKIPNLGNVAPRYADAPFDPFRTYSMPYTTSLTGIGFRKSKMPQGLVPDTWKWVFDSDRFRGRIAVPGDPGWTLPLVAKYLGHSINDISDDLLARVETVLTKQARAGRLKFHNDDGEEMLLHGEVDLVVECNADVRSVMERDPDLAFVVPKEGTLIQDCCLCIPAGALHPENAHAFINFTLDARNGSEIANTLGYTTPNAAARALMPAAYRDDPTLFPETSIMARSEYAAWAPEREQTFDTAMTRIRLAAA